MFISLANRSKCNNKIIFRKETSPNMATQVTSKAKINQNATKYQSKPMQAYSNWFISLQLLLDP